MNCFSKWLSCVQGVDGEVFSSVREGLWSSMEVWFGICFQRAASSRINVEPFSSTVSRSCNASTHLHRHFNAGCLATTWLMMNLPVAKKQHATHPKTTDCVFNISVCVRIKKKIKIQHINSWALEGLVGGFLFPLNRARLAALHALQLLY